MITLLKNIWLSVRPKRSRQGAIASKNCADCSDIPAATASEAIESRASHPLYLELMAGYQENIDRVDVMIARERERFLSKGDWLVFLPSAAGSAELIERACKYLEEMRTRVEAEDGTMLWLCKDHDCATRIFEILEFRVVEGAVFCAGEWTALGQKYRHKFKGVSHDNIAFAGDIGLLTEMTPPVVACMNLADMPAEVRAAAQSDRVRGLVGAACLSFEPAYGKTGIYRLSYDKKRMIAATLLSPELTTNKSIRSTNHQIHEKKHHPFS